MSPILPSSQVPSSQVLSSPLVEVYVQDYFFENNFSSNDSPISEELWQTCFHQWLTDLHSTLEPPYRSGAYEVGLRLTNDAEVQGLNAQYRQKDQPTDVLSFATLEGDYPELPEDQSLEAALYLGDIVISVETAQRQADQQGHSLQQELGWLAAHALLHLLGWDHPDEATLEQMLRQQESMLQTVGLAIGYYPIAHSGD